MTDTISPDVIGYIFDYAPLIGNVPADIPGRPVVYGTLVGYQRDWDVAYSNQHKDFDHAYWVDPESDERLFCVIAGLGIAPQEGILCNGLAIPVTQKTLAEYDWSQDHCYTRSGDMGSDFTWEAEGSRHNLDLPVWVYLPKPEALAHFEEELEYKRVYLPGQYRDKVLGNIKALDPINGLETFEASTLEATCPTRELNLKES